MKAELQYSYNTISVLYNLIVFEQMGICTSQNDKKKQAQVKQKNISTDQTKAVEPPKVTSESTHIRTKSQNLHLQEMKQPISFGIHENPQNKQFKVTKSFGALKVERVSYQTNDGNMYTFFKNGEIPKGQITSFKLKLRTKERMFNIGIGTKATFGDKATDETIKQQSKQLWFDNKKCFVDHEMYSTPQLPQNGYIQVIINTRQWTIGWYMQSYHIVTKDIPYKMRQNSFYLTIALYNNGDEAQEILLK